MLIQDQPVEAVEQWAIFGGDRIDVIPYCLVHCIQLSDELSYGSDSGIPMAAFNFAIRLRTGADPGGQIDTVRQTFARRSMPFVWWVTQEDSQDGLETHLRRHGLEYGG